MPGGRPSKYKPEYCERLIKHMEGGLSFPSFAGTIAVNVDTLYHWEELYPEFSEAKSVGLALNLLFWESLGRAAAMGRDMKDKNGKPISLKNFNATVWIFNMKNRHGWRDRQEVDMQVKVEPFVVETSDGEKTTMGGKKNLC